MLRNIALALAFGLLTFACGPQPSANAQEKHDNAVKTIATDTFHGKVHQTSGRATIYREADAESWSFV